MTIKLSRILAFAFTIALMASPLVYTVAHAQPERYQAGNHYQVLDNPMRTGNPEKIEVIDVFWYGCGGCFSFQPLIANWEQNAADDIDFVHFPAMWNELMKVHARAYYTAESLGVVDQVHEAIFNAYHLQNNRLQNETQLATFFANHGVSREDFTSAYNSFAVSTQVNQAERKMGRSGYGIQYTPTVIVNGKYRVTVDQGVRNQQELLEVVDFLVDRERRAASTN